MLAEDPRLIIAFHERLNPRAAHGGTSGMCLFSLLVGVPVWLVPARTPTSASGYVWRCSPSPRARKAVSLLQRKLPPPMTRRIQLAG
jgi:hypothetical protein